eukprot:COSAG02_NODE_22345_length_755_cov_1.397866_1_plen_25_part_10
MQNTGAEWECASAVRVVTRRMHQQR